MDTFSWLPLIFVLFVCFLFVYLFVCVLGVCLSLCKLLYFFIEMDIFTLMRAWTHSLDSHSSLFFLLVCLFACLFVSLFVCLFVHLFACVFFVCSSVCLCVWCHLPTIVVIRRRSRDCLAVSRFVLFRWRIAWTILLSRYWLMVRQYWYWYWLVINNEQHFPNPTPPSLFRLTLHINSLNDEKFKT